jgi:hypothetical protein
VYSAHREVRRMPGKKDVSHRVTYCLNGRMIRIQRMTRMVVKQKQASLS